jgi:hypothetical protein
MEHELNIDTNIVRFIITKVEKNAPKPLKYADFKTETKVVVEEKKDEVAEKSAKKTDTPKSEEKKTEVKKDDVDKKLDAILDDASIGL